MNGRDRAFGPTLEQIAEGNATPCHLVESVRRDKEDIRVISGAQTDYFLKIFWWLGLRLSHCGLCLRSNFGLADDEADKTCSVILKA